MTRGPKKSIGVNYGVIRADIDIEKLNTYLQTQVSVVTAPVQVQQFEVCPTTSFRDIAG